MNSRYVAWGIAVVILSISAANADVSNKGNTLQTPSGRYVFGQISEMRRDQFLLDTKTGQLWRSVTDSNGHELMEPMYFSFPQDRLCDSPSAERCFIFHLETPPTNNQGQPAAPAQ